MIAQAWWAALQQKISHARTSPVFYGAAVTVTDPAYLLWDAHTSTHTTHHLQQPQIRTWQRMASPWRSARRCGTYGCRRQA